MENINEREFLLASILDISSGSPPPHMLARFTANGISFLSGPDEVTMTFNTNCELFKLGPYQAICIEKAPNEESYARGISIQFKDENVSKAFHCAFKDWKSEVDVEGTSASMKSDEAFSARLFFEYYGTLAHPGPYHDAVYCNSSDFADKHVINVCAGSSLLSLFVIQAGASTVHAIETSDMQGPAMDLVSANTSHHANISAITSRIQNIRLEEFHFGGKEKADILVFEAMGVLLVNSKMLETYIMARDRLLVTKGKMFPSKARMSIAPFSDQQLYDEIKNKASFWDQKDYKGVDLTPLHEWASDGFFSQPVVDISDRWSLLDTAYVHETDLQSITANELYDIDIPLLFAIPSNCTVHGVVCWFDVFFDGSTKSLWLTTVPRATAAGASTDHYQLHFCLKNPIRVTDNQDIIGRFHMKADKSQSYIVNLELSSGKGIARQKSSGTFHLKDSWYRMSQRPA